MYRLVIIGICLALSFPLRAQETEVNSTEADSVSYSLYTQAKWQQLIHYADEALRSGIDFYYLRMRAGIAAYNMHQYRSAAMHFEKANAMNPFEEVAMEYLYWSYIFSERYDEAMKLGRDFSPALKEQSGLNNKKRISFALLESGIKLPDKSSVADPLSYLQLGAGHDIKNKVSIFHAVSYLQQKVYWGSYQQFEYYARLNIPLKKAWILSPALHVLQLDASPYYKNTYFLGSVQAVKNMRYLQAGLATSYSDIYKGNQVQANLNLRVYPFAHNRFWLGTSVAAQKTDSGGINTFMQHIVSCNAGPRLNLSAWFLHGNTRNFNEANGYMLNNSLDLTRQRITLMGTYSFHSKWDFYALLQNEQKTEFFNNTPYQFNTFIIGFKYKP